MNKYKVVLMPHTNAVNCNEYFLTPNGILCRCDSMLESYPAQLVDEEKNITVSEDDIVGVLRLICFIDKNFAEGDIVYIENNPIGISSGLKEVDKLLLKVLLENPLVLENHTHKVLGVPSYKANHLNAGDELNDDDIKTENGEILYHTNPYLGYDHWTRTKPSIADFFDDALAHIYLKIKRKNIVAFV